MLRMFGAHQASRVMLQCVCCFQINVFLCSTLTGHSAFMICLQFWNVFKEQRWEDFYEIFRIPRLENKRNSDQLTLSNDYKPTN